MKNIWLTVAVVLTPFAAHAGGDATMGYVTNFKGKAGQYSFHFQQVDEKHELVPGCSAFDVEVRYKRLASKAHPSLEETELAAAMIRKAHDEKQPVNFGYMGSGLLPTGKPCTFKSKGLRIFEDPVGVLSFHNPI